MLILNNLIGFGAAQPVAAASVTLTFLQGATDVANKGAGGTYSFATQNIGAADASRVVIAGVAISGNTENSSVTIGGVSATKVEALANGLALAEIWAAAVPTGTTATVVITVGGNTTRARLTLFRMVGGNIVATDTAENSSAAGSTSAAITIPAGGAGVGIVTNSDHTTDLVWTNASEVDDEALETNTKMGAATIAASATVSCAGGVDDQAMVLAAWGP